MTNPIWVFNTHKNLLDDTVIGPSAFLTEGLFVNFTSVMEGKIQIEGIGSPVSVVNGIIISVYNSFNAVNDSIPILELTIPLINAVSRSASISLLSGLYVLGIGNLDPVNSITINLTSNTLSWPT